MKYIEEYRGKFKSFMELFTMNSKSSAWTIGCSQHGYTWNKYYDSNRERVPATSGPKIRDAL